MINWGKYTFTWNYTVPMWCTTINGQKTRAELIFSPSWAHLRASFRAARRGAGAGLVCPACSSSGSASLAQEGAEPSRAGPELWQPVLRAALGHNIPGGISSPDAADTTAEGFFWFSICTSFLSQALQVSGFSPAAAARFEEERLCISRATEQRSLDTTGHTERLCISQSYRANWPHTPRQNLPLPYSGFRGFRPIVFSQFWC